MHIECLAGVKGEPSVHNYRRNEDVRASEPSSVAPRGFTALLRSVSGGEGGVGLRVLGKAGKAFRALCCTAAHSVLCPPCPNTFLLNTRPAHSLYLLFVLSAVTLLINSRLVLAHSSSSSSLTHSWSEHVLYLLYRPLLPLSTLTHS